MPRVSGSIKIDTETKQRLTDRKRGNDTYDDVIKRLLDKTEPED
jgi:predicted CopG family antitoxin